jgi:hypothetical protein
MPDDSDNTRRALAASLGADMEAIQAAVEQHKAAGLVPVQPRPILITEPPTCDPACVVMAII